MTAAGPSSPLTYVVGHRNPDADAICSAIAYAAYKTACGEHGYVPARCGNSNARIDTILSRFHHPLPLYLSDVSPRVHDLMTTEVVSVPPTATCAEALEFIDRFDLRVLPVVDENRRLAGTVSVFTLGHFFLPKVNEPKLMRKVHTSLADLARALRARVLHMVEENRTEDLFVRIGAMDITSFWRISQAEGIPPGQSAIIVGDRVDIQNKSMDIGVRLLVITGNLPVSDEVVARARACGVSLIVSPYDSATTAWVIRTAGRISKLMDTNFTIVSPDTRIADMRKKLAVSSAPAYMVLADDGRLLGVLSKSDILRPVPTRLVLVDHNELTQAVPGADEVMITEIIDHHRLGPLATPQPILFLNEPIGSTSTIVAGLFRSSGHTPDPDLAGLMMSGIISDTLLLQSPTSTSKDAQLLDWLSSIAQVQPKELAELIFSSGSVILASAPAKVVRSDFKIYEEDGVQFSVSQVEELGFNNFWANAKNLAEALTELTHSENLAFACLLVTDINTQNSLMLVKGDPEVIRRISYSHVEQDRVFDLPGVVSRKKQLIPYLTSLLKEMTAEGVLPSPARNRHG
ncbi:putative manganese-dependent inorganic diphosphatase [Horticoccus luteus]|uniref:inorganic diphosphatase n=1 Tax=Horticoccus luteus TaxID=2862869 RepID=A0A8F9TYM3_9BACT|nr:putative manganese-dependent inorganic diphosphatase [Horticoccus luteus]QYM80406.1 putative manganese-dependent inorganic diphosphatase [Horticoccus luteus]